MAMGVASVGAAKDGGGVIRVGAVLWMVHSLLILVGTITGLSLLGGGTSAVTERVTLTGASFIGACALAFAAALLVGLGLRAYRNLPGAQASRGPAGLTAVLLWIYGALALVPVATLLVMWGGVDFDTLANGLRAILVAWFIASVLLVVAGLTLSRFVRALRTERGSAPKGFGWLFAYALVNVVGVAMISLPLLLTPADDVALRVAAIGALIELLAIPIVGLIIFLLLFFEPRRWAMGPPPLTLPPPPPL